MDNNTIASNPSRSSSSSSPSDMNSNSRMSQNSLEEEMKAMEDESCATPSSSWRNLLYLFTVSKMRTFIYIGRSLCKTVVFFYKFVAFHVHPFWIELAYFLILAFLGSVVMINLNPRSSFTQKYVDMLYMSTAAVTISGLNSVDTENFSETQIVVLTFLMFVGGEVFVSLVSLLFRGINDRLVVSSSSSSSTGDNAVVVEEIDSAEMGEVVVIFSRSLSMDNIHKDDLIKRNSIKYLGYVVLCYIAAVHVIGFVPIFIYLNEVSSARDVLESKGLRIVTFAVSTVVSSFANVGILAANENMGRFKTNSGLLLMLIPLILAGNTLYPAFLRLVLLSIHRLISDKKRPEFDLLLKNSSELDYPHLLPSPTVAFQSMTNIGMVAVLSTFFGAMNWNSDILFSLNPYQKFVGVIFQSVNSRHSGELAFDMSLAAPAVLVLFIVLMYLPAYTIFSPNKEEEKKTNRKNKSNLSQLSYVVMFVIVVCIIERKKLSTDPLNFSILNIVFEVVSAYGNVGLSMGYSCGRRLTTTDDTCMDASYSFSGRWSNGGKYFLIFVMIFGKLKKYHMGGGKAWILK